MVLKHLSKVIVQFSPHTGNSRSAREFLARVTAPKARASNPECTLDGRVRISGDPFVEITYKNQQVERIACGTLSVQKIMEQINARSAEMDTAASLKAAGFADVKLHSDFGGAGSTEARETGTSRKIMPR